MDYKTTLDTLIARQDLDQAHMREVMDAVMDGQLTQAQIGALLVALRMKGETTAEIAGLTSGRRSWTDTGSTARMQCRRPAGSECAKGGAPVSAWYSVAPTE